MEKENFKITVIEQKCTNCKYFHLEYGMMGFPDTKECLKLKLYFNEKDGLNVDINSFYCSFFSEKK